MSSLDLQQTETGTAVRAADRRRLRMPLSVPAALLILLLVTLIGPPLYYLVKTSLYTTEFDGSFGTFTLDAYRELFASTRLFDHLRNSLVFALGSGCLAIALGALQAWIVERTNTPLRRYAFLTAIVSLGIPHVLYTIAWLLILGKQGPVNQLLMGLTGTDEPLFMVNSMTGMILIEGMIWTPLAFLMLSSVFRSFDGGFEEAAVMSGAGPFTTFRRITMVLALPALLALFMLICIRAFEAFDIPALVGTAGGVSVLSTDIFESIRKDLPPNYGLAGAFSVVLMGIVALLLMGQGRVLANAERFQTITGKGFRPRVIDLRGWRFVMAGVLVAYFTVLIILPVAIIALTAFLPFYDGLHVGMFSRLTLENFRLVLGGGSFRSAIGNTLVMGAATATLVCLLTAGGAWLAARRQPGGRILNQLATLPLVFPAIVLGVAFLQVFVSLPVAIYGTLASLVIAATVQYLPYGMRFSYAGALQIHRELEEAAGAAGASRWQIFRRVVLPLMMPAVATSWLFVLLLSVRAVGMPILLAGPGNNVVAVTIFDLWGNGQVTAVAALGLLWAALMMGIGVVFHHMSRRYGLDVK
jgi:iron(III) transport system permease protein